MDRRSWMLFFCILSTTLLINHYFSPKISLENQETVWLESIRTNLQEKEAQSIPSFNDLSLIEAVADTGEKLFGVDLAGNFLTIAQRLPMPKTVMINHQLGKLAFLNHAVEPIVYRTNEKTLVVHKPDLLDGSLFYIAYQKDGIQQPQIVLATKQKDRIISSQNVLRDSLVFDREHRVIGIFEASSQKIRSFHDYLRLANQVSISDITEETYYVLENEYQMLVFSSKGGSLAEINLPFASEENTQSVVQKISVDRIMQEKHPSNTRFPESPYFTLENGVVTQKDPVVGSYYPLLRRDLFTPSGEVKQAFDPRLYCCAISEEGEDPGIYQVTRFEKNLIEFRSTGARRNIIKRYTLPENSKEMPYVFFLNVEVEGNTQGLFVQSGIPEVELISGYFSPALKYLVKRNEQTTVNQLSLPKVQDDQAVSLSTFSPEWIVNSNGFLGLILDPLTYQATGLRAKALAGNSVPTRLSVIDAAYNLYPANDYPGYSMLLPFSSQNSAEFRIFAGPFESDTLQAVDQAVQNATGSNPEYTKAQSSHGWFSFISAPFSKFLFLLMRLFHAMTNSWGLSIILLTVVMRILLYPLNAWSFKAGQRSHAVMPEVKKIQEKYKKQPEKAQLEIVKLYKETGYNPFMGCFPAFIQMPFLLGMLDLLKSSFDLRGASFIPGWIDNLAAPDVLFSWGYPIFYLGTSFHLLPVIFALVTLAQQKLTIKWSGVGQEPLTEQQKQQQAVGNVMVIVLTVALYHFPSGLNIYWIFSTALGILQQYFMHLRKKPEDAKSKKNLVNN